MSNGISSENSAGKKRGNGRTDADTLNEGREIVTPPKADDLLSQFMTLDGHSLRAVFDRSIAAHAMRVTQEKQRFEETNGDLVKRVLSINEEIGAMNVKIDSLRSKVVDLQNLTKREASNHEANMTALNKERDLIENMRTLLKSKLEGSV